jgi:hypothetical protein
MLLRYEKATGAITSGAFVGGTGNDQALALWCNTATKEAFVGGGFQNSVSIPAPSGSTVRVAAGSFDGFLFRITPATGSGGFSVNLNGNALGLAPEGSLKAWPNPASGIINVSSEFSGPVHLQEVRGGVLFTKTLSANQAATFQIGHLPAGIYLLRQGKLSLRVVVQ